MFDYRLKALAKALETESADAENRLSIKETGSAEGGFVSQDTEVDHEDYLDLLDSFFEKLEEGAVPVDACMDVIRRLLQMFQEETEEVEEVCQTLTGLDDLVTAWKSQTKVIVNALNRTANLYLDEKEEGLTECFESIEEALRERLPLYARYQIAHAKYVEQEVLPQLEELEADPPEEDELPTTS